MIRVALPFTRSDTSWMGGTNYLVNLVQAVSSIPDPQIEFVLLIAPEALETASAAFPSTPYLTTDLLSGRSALRVLSKGLELGLGKNVILERFLRRNNIAAISHDPGLGTHSHFPCITWIPDFQHIHLPQFFSEDQISQRTAGLNRIINSRNLILLSSAHAQSDLKAIAPQVTGRTRVLRFVSGLQDGSTPSLQTLKEKYGLNELYFHLPNQFWQHKNHTVVADALHLLATRGVNVQVICTGHTDDFRHPAYFREFQRRLNDLRLTASMRILGVVPYADMRGLMRHAVAILNPSRFEGWSTSVEEGKSLGKTVLLSDIPVHREQAPPFSAFFPPDSADQLADQMSNSLREFSRERDSARVEQARLLLPKRFSDFGRAYQSLVIDTLGQRRPQKRTVT